MFLFSAKTAEAARPMLTQEKFSGDYNIRSDYYDNDYGFDFTNVLSYTSSEDNLRPKYWRYATRSKTSEWNEVRFLSLIRIHPTSDVCLNVQP